MIQELLDELDAIQCFEQPGSSIRVGETTKSRKKFIESLELNHQPRYNYFGSQGGDGSSSPVKNIKLLQKVGRKLRK